jgi:hypothetical protein
VIDHLSRNSGNDNEAHPTTPVAITGQPLPYAKFIEKTHDAIPSSIFVPHMAGGAVSQGWPDNEGRWKPF